MGCTVNTAERKRSIQTIFSSQTAFATVSYLEVNLLQIRLEKYKILHADAQILNLVFFA